MTAGTNKNQSALNSKTIKIYIEKGGGKVEKEKQSSKRVTLKTPYVKSEKRGGRVLKDSAGRKNTIRDSFKNGSTGPREKLKSLKGRGKKKWDWTRRKNYAAERITLEQNKTTDRVSHNFDARD